METTLPPQPPPDAPAPPPGEEALRSRGKMKLILWVGALCAVPILLFPFVAPLLLSSRKASDRVEAISNAKQVGMALFEFEAEYGQFPDAATVAAVKAKTGTTLTLGSGRSSNELFRQLLASRVRSEKIFHAKSAITPRKGNDILGPDALVKGECAFTYVAGLSSSADPDAPVLMVPVIPGTLKFDPKPFKGKAIVLRAGSSARVETVTASGDVMINGMNLFDPRQPYWRGKAPDIKWPE